MQSTAIDDHSPDVEATFCQLFDDILEGLVVDNIQAANFNIVRLPFRITDPFLPSRVEAHCASRDEYRDKKVVGLLSTLLAVLRKR
jgi:hypothetical protein